MNAITCNGAMTSSLDKEREALKYRTMILVKMKRMQIYYLVWLKSWQWNCWLWNVKIKRFKCVRRVIIWIMMNWYQVIKQILLSYQFTRICFISSYPHYNAKNQLPYKVVVGGIKQSFKINGSNMWLRQRPNVSVCFVCMTIPLKLRT